MKEETIFIQDTSLNPPATQTRYPGRILLVVEDDAQVGVQLATWVTWNGWKARLARSMAEAEGKAKAPDVSLAILDLKLPDSQGADSVRRLKRVAPTLPIIVITGTNEDERELRAAGAHAYVSKPIDFGQLREKVEDLLAAKAAVEQLHSPIRAALERTREKMTCLSDSHVLARIDVATDGEGRVVAWSHRAQVMFGWSEGEAIGKRISALVVPDNIKAVHDSAMARVREGPQSEISSKINSIGMRKDGSTFGVLVSVRGIRTKEGWTFVATVEEAR